MSRISATSSESIDLAAVERIVRAAGRGREAAIPILQAIQAEYCYLPEAALRRVCELTEITPAQISGVATFYNQFRRQPVGEHIIRVCHGTACHVAGSPLVTDALRRHLGLKDESADTDRDGRFTVEKVPCLGCCTLAPVLQIDDVTYGHLTPQSVPEVLADFLRRKKATASSSGAGVINGPALGEIRIGLGSCCQAQGSAGVREAISATLAESGAAVVVKRVGCVGMCHQTPLVEVRPASGEPRLFAKVKVEDAREIVLSQFRPRGLVRRMAYEVRSFVESFVGEESGRERAGRLAIDAREDPVCAFLGPQQHVATEYGGQIDPTNLDEYLKNDGFKALGRCLGELDEEGIIAEMRTAGLRGRGGAGFPTAVKWASVREAQGTRKFAICNGDEGDPGAFMDRMILESFPYRVIEGLAIAARAVGAHEAVFYVRAEYPLATERIAEALKKCEERGLLGPRVMGHDFALHVTLKQGAGAFVCGEETALVASIEGRRGMPRLRPPYPSEHGLWGQPTLVNNVETYACVPWIIRHGGAAFAAMGTPTSRGTKVFALAGRIKRGGLIEVPMGVTLRRIVEEIGGGTKSGRPLKAVQVGGPSGGCIPASLADTPVDYEDLARAGSIMGSGGLVVLDEGDCMVDMARYFLGFTQDQSCGKCTFCRIGTKRMLEILDRLCAGQGRAADLAALEELSDRVRRTSLCGLGRTAPNPVVSTLRHFREEYEAHLAGRCPAKRCRALIKYRINDKCIGCTRCAQRCPVQAIAPRPYEQHEVDVAKCVRCGTCQAVCPVDAVEVD